MKKSASKKAQKPKKISPARKSLLKAPLKVPKAAPAPVVKMTFPVCPRCHSTDVSKDTTLATGVNPYYQCKHCGYQSQVFPEVNQEELKNLPPVVEMLPAPSAPKSKAGWKVAGVLLIVAAVMIAATFLSNVIYNGDQAMAPMFYASIVFLAGLLMLMFGLRK